MRIALLAILALALVNTTFAQRGSSPRPRKAEKQTETNAAANRTGIVKVTIRDKATGKSVPARLLIRDAQGKSQKPDGVIPAWTLADKWFMCDGRAEVAVPVGKATVRVERGKEYYSFKQETLVKEGETTELTVELQRWIDTRALGYSNGENHLHIKYEWLAGMLAGEDLDFGSTLQWWNRPMPEMGVPAAGGALRSLQFGGATVPACVFDAEWENAFGAIYAIGLPEPLEMDGDKRRSALPYCRKVKEMGGLVCYQAGWSAEVLVDSLLGYVDVVNVCNNMFQRYRFLPRLSYMNVLGVEELPVFEPTAEGMFTLNTESYYRLLNCGLRMPAGAGSATPVKVNPAGYNRAYVRAGENPSYQQFLQAWRAGRNFVTNGPMVFLTVNDSLRPGDSIEFDSQGGEVTIEAQAISDQPLKALEIIVNGDVAATADVTADATSADVTLKLTIEKGSWIAARAIDDDQTLDEDEIENYKKNLKLKNPNDLSGYLRALTSMRYGHTSPIYVAVGGQSALVERALDEASRMLDAFEDFVHRNTKEEYQPEILEGLAEACERLEALRHN